MDRDRFRSDVRLRRYEEIKIWFRNVPQPKIYAQRKGLRTEKAGCNETGKVLRGQEDGRKRLRLGNEAGNEKTVDRVDKVARRRRM